MKPLLIFFVIALTLYGCSKPVEKVEAKYPDGKPKVISYYENDDTTKKVGEIQLYQNGKEKVKGDLDNDKREGTWTYWYPNGNKWSECGFRNGLKHGKNITYFENGKIRYEGEYHQDERVGVWKFYDESGKLVKEEDMDKKQ